jgi:hypothetical protein
VLRVCELSPIFNQPLPFLTIFPTPGPHPDGQWHKRRRATRGPPRPINERLGLGGSFSAKIVVVKLPLQPHSKKTNSGLALRAGYRERLCPVYLARGRSRDSSLSCETGLNLSNLTMMSGGQCHSTDDGMLRVGTPPLRWLAHPG